jgi:hypothetical protein
VEAFYLTGYGSKITKTDIKIAIVRIPVQLKPWFPAQDPLLTISYQKMDRTVQYAKKPGRFDLIYLGEDFMHNLHLHPGGRLKVTRQGKHHLVLENADFLISNEEMVNIEYEDLPTLKSDIGRL